MTDPVGSGGQVRITAPTVDENKAPAPKVETFQQKLDTHISLLFTRDSTYKGGYDVTGGPGGPFVKKKDEYVTMSKRVAEKYIAAHDGFQDSEVKKAAVYFATAVLGTGNGKKFAGIIGGDVKDEEIYAKFEDFMKGIGVGKTGRGWTGGNFAEFIKNVTGAEYDATTSKFKPPALGTNEGTQLDVSPARISAEANAVLLSVLNEHPVMGSVGATVDSLATEDIKGLLVICDTIAASPLSGEMCGAVADKMGKENKDVATALKEVGADMSKYQPGKTADEKIDFLARVSGIPSETAEKTVAETAKAVLDDAEFKGEKRAEFVHAFAQREGIISEGTDGVHALSADREDAAKKIIKEKAEAAGITVDDEGLSTALENFKKNVASGNLDKKVYETSFLKKNKVSGQEVLEELLKGELEAKASVEVPQAADYNATYLQIEAGVKTTYEFLASERFSEEDVANIPANVITRLTTDPDAAGIGAKYDERTETGKIDKLKGAYEVLFGAGSWEGEAQPAALGNAPVGGTAGLQTGAVDEANADARTGTSGQNAASGEIKKLDDVNDAQGFKSWLLSIGVDQQTIDSSTAKIDEMCNSPKRIKTLKNIIAEDAGAEPAKQKEYMKILLSEDMAPQ